jgi:hypothetical protein
VETNFSGYSQYSEPGFDPSVSSSATMGLSDEAMASIGSDENQDQSFFGGSDTPNVMDFGRGPVSNISNAANFDPNFAALGMIGRGLTPGFDLRNQISFDVPSQMLPQLEGSRGPLAPKFYSPVERTLVEMEPVGIMSIIGKGLQSIMDTAKSSFSDAKSALGFKGDAAGGLKDEDFTGLMGTRDDQQISDMSQIGAQMNVTDPVVSAPASVNMASVPQVSPVFDQFGNAYRSGFDRNMAEMAQQSLSGGIASVAPSRATEVTQAMTNTFNTTYGDLPTSLPGVTNPNMALALQIRERRPDLTLGQAMNMATMELAKRKRLGVN